MKTNDKDGIYPQTKEALNSQDCPSFWQDCKIRINPVDFTNRNSSLTQEYGMKNIKTAVYVGMSLNIAIVLLFLISFRHKLKRIYKTNYEKSIIKCCSLNITLSSRVKSILFMFPVFMESLVPLTDSILGEFHLYVLYFQCKT